MKKTTVKSKSKAKPKSTNKIKLKSEKMSDVSWGYLIAGIFEAAMAIPIVGWSMGVGSFGFFWVVGLVINIVVLTIVKRSKKSISGNVVGIIANIIGWMPILGWLLHVTATILLFVLFFKEERR